MLPLILLKAAQGHPVVRFIPGSAKLLKLVRCRNADDDAHFLCRFFSAARGTQKRRNL